MTITNAGDDALDIESHSGDVSFAAFTAAMPGSSAIEIDNASGSIDFNGAFEATDVGTDAIVVVNSDGAFTFADTVSITDAASEGIVIDALTGSATFDGAVTIGGMIGDDAIDIDDSENATIAFNSTVDINDAGDDGIEINGSGAGTATGSITFADTLTIDNANFGIFLASTVADLSFEDVVITNAGIDGVLGSSTLVLVNSGISFASLSIDGPADGIDLNAVTSVGGAGLTIGDLSISNVSTEALEIDDFSAPFTVTGLTTIDAPGVAGIMLDSTTGDFTFGDVDITGLGDNATGVDLTNSQSNVSFNTLDITGVSTTGTRGVDLTGATFAGNAVTIDSGTIQGVDIGVDLTNADITGTFQYGDGSNTDADGAASTIDAVTPIVFTGINSASGVYDFEDVNLVGDISAFGSPTVFWVLGGATGAGTRLDPGSLAAAELSGAGVIILLNDPTGGDDTLNAAGTNGDDTLNLADNQRLFSFETSDTLDGITNAPVNLLTFGIGDDFINPFAGSGAPTLTTSTGDTVTLGNANELDGLLLSGADSAIFGANIAGLRIENSSFTGTGGGGAIDINTSSGAQVFDNLTFTNPTSNSTAFNLFGTSGSLTATNISISSSGTDWFRGLDLSNGGGSTEALSLTLDNFDVSDFSSQAVVLSYDQADNGSLSIVNSEFVGASAADGILLAWASTFSGTFSEVNVSNNTFSGGVFEVIETTLASGATGTITTATFDNNDATAVTGANNGFDLDFASNASANFNIGTLNITNNQIGAAGAPILDDGVTLNLDSSSGAIQTVNFSGNTIFAGTGAGTGSTAALFNIDAGVYEFAIDANTLSSNLSGASATSQAFNFNADDADDPDVTITSFSGNALGANNNGGFAFVGSVDASGDATLTFDADTGAVGFQTVDAGSLTIGTTGARVFSDGLSLTNVQGALSFDDLDIANDGGFGLEVNNSAVTAGKDFTLAIDAGDAFDATVDTVNGAAIFLDPLTVDINLASVASSGGVNGILFDGVDGTFDVSGATTISGTTGFGIAAIGANGGTFTFGGPVTITPTAGAGGVNLDSGTLAFNGFVDINATTGGGVDADGGTLSFGGGFDIDTTNGLGFGANGVALEITGAPGSVNTTTGRILNFLNVNLGASGAAFSTLSATGVAVDTAVNLFNIDGGAFNGGDVTVAGTLTNDGLRIGGGSSSAFSFNAVTIINPADDAVQIDGIQTGAIMIADLDIALESANSTGFDIAGATIDASVTATDFDLTDSNGTGTTGVILDGATGTGSVTLGDTTAAGADASIGGAGGNAGGPAVGVAISSATNIDFTFGDGEDPTDTGSSITAVDVFNFTGGAPANGTYDFDDVVFAGDTSDIMGLSVFFVDDANDAGAGTSADPGSITGANASSADVIAFIDRTLDGMSSNIATTTALALAADQVLVSLAAAAPWTFPPSASASAASVRISPSTQHQAPEARRSSMRRAALIRSSPH